MSRSSLWRGMQVTREAVRLCLPGGRGHMGGLYTLLNFALNLKLPSIKSTKEKKKEKQRTRNWRQKDLVLGHSGYLVAVSWG